LNPAISVLIATYNRASVLRDTLEAMARLEQPEGGWELIVTDNNSTDATRSVCSEYAEILPLTYLFEPRQGKSLAINRAIDAARGQLVLITDDDVTPTSGWLRAFVAGANRHPAISFFGGPVRERFIQPPAWFEPAVRGVTSFGQAWLGHEDTPYPPEHRPPGANMLIRRAAILETGIRYESDLGPRGKGRISGADKAFVEAFRRAGYEMMYLADAVVEHRTYRRQMRLGSLKRRAFGQGRGQARLGRRFRSVLGVPLWVLPRIAGNVTRLLIGCLEAPRRHRLEFQLSFQLGYAYEKLLMRLRHPPDAGPAKSTREHSVASNARGNG